MPKSDLTQDRIFRFVFGEPAALPILKSLINSYFKAVKIPLVECLELLPREIGSETTAEKQPVLDVLAKDQNGRVINIEIQTLSTPQFLKRVLFYAARLYGRQLPMGSSYLDLKPVICLCLLEFDIESSDQWLHYHTMSGIDDISLVMVELTKLTRLQTGPTADSQDLKEAVEWSKFIEDPCEEPVREGFEPLFRIARRRMEDFMAITPEIYHELRRELIENDIATWKRWEHERGLEEGLEKGLEKGSHDTAIEIATRLLHMNQSAQDVSLATGLTLEEVEALKTS